jgi:hypothetical protein
MEKVRLQIFNHPSRNGLVYMEDSVESVTKLISTFSDENPLYLTSKTQGLENVSRTVDFTTIVGVFKNLEIRETGD